MQIKFQQLFIYLVKWCRALSVHERELASQHCVPMYLKLPSTLVPQTESYLYPGRYELRSFQDHSAIFEK